MVMLRFVFVMFLCLSLPATAQSGRLSKTFPLGVELTESVSACYTQEAAEQVVKAFERKDRAAFLIFNMRGCFSTEVTIKYTKRVMRVKVNGVFLNVYEGVVGSLTVYVITDWNHSDKDV